MLPTTACVYCETNPFLSSVLSADSERKNKEGLFRSELETTSPHTTGPLFQLLLSPERRFKPNDTWIQQPWPSIISGSPIASRMRKQSFVFLPERWSLKIFAVDKKKSESVCSLGLLIQTRDRAATSSSMRIVTRRVAISTKQERIHLHLHIFLRQLSLWTREKYFPRKHSRY